MSTSSTNSSTLYQDGASSLSPKSMSANRFWYIIEAGVEYLISLLLLDSFLAQLLTANGVADSATGIITEITVFAFSAQIFSVFYKKRGRKKLFVTVLHLINQLLFVMLYFMPSFNLPSSVKVTLIVCMFLLGHVVANIVSPYKLSWLMSYVPANKRGIFTANKEIVSLIMGMIFSISMGSLSDYYKSIGRQDVFFAICAATILVLAILHMVTLLLIKEAPDKEAIPTDKTSFAESVKKTLTNRTLLLLALIDVIWRFATSLSVSFYGVYKINELGFSMKYFAFLSILSSVSRIAFSRFFGKLADKYSWTKTLIICFSIDGISFLINVFTVPTNGKLLFAVHSCLHALAMGGIVSGLMNIVFDHTNQEDRPSALGIKATMSGISGFLASLAGGAIIHYIQLSGNRLFSQIIYGQQVLSAISFVICVALIFYVKLIICKIKK